MAEAAGMNAGILTAVLIEIGCPVCIQIGIEESRMIEIQYRHPFSVCHLGEQFDIMVAVFFRNTPEHDGIRGTAVSLAEIPRRRGGDADFDIGCLFPDVVNRLIHTAPERFGPFIFGGAEGKPPAEIVEAAEDRDHIRIGKVDLFDPVIEGFIGCRHLIAGGTAAVVENIALKVLLNKVIVADFCRDVLFGNTVTEHNPGNL